MNLGLGEVHPVTIGRRETTAAVIVPADDASRVEVHLRVILVGRQRRRRYCWRMQHPDRGISVERGWRRRHWLIPHFERLTVFARVPADRPGAAPRSRTWATSGPGPVRGRPSGGDRRRIGGSSNRAASGRASAASSACAATGFVVHNASLVTGTRLGVHLLLPNLSSSCGRVGWSILRDRSGRLAESRLRAAPDDESPRRPPR